MIGGSMDTIDCLGLLSLILALAAYVSAVRLAIMNKRDSLTKTAHEKLNLTDEEVKSMEDKRKNLRIYLQYLAPADIFLVISAISLFLKIFYIDLFNSDPPVVLNKVVVYSFGISVIILALHHMYAWYKTYCRTCNIRELFRCVH